MTLEFKLQEMKHEDADEVVKLISKAMNENEGKWARETIDFSYFCKANGKNDGRSYWIGKKDGKTVGICGLHRYLWGPKDIVWLGWFAVAPEFQRQSIGHNMMEGICERALRMGYRKMFIETYSNDDFLKGRSFYKKFGFRKVGKIKSYIKEGTDMIIYGKDLSRNQ